MKKKKKYRYGTGNNVVRHYIESPQEAMAENEINVAKAKLEGETNPWSMGLNVLGNMAMNYGTSMMSKGIAQGDGADGKGLDGFLAGNGKDIMGLLQMGGNMFATGGTAEGEIEAEGDEIVQTPDGQTTELKGPKHEQGGIDIDVPKGTEIFSDRILKDGKTMAERKKARDNRLKSLKKKMEKSSGKVEKDTYKRTLEALALEEQQDLQLQDLISFMAGSQGEAMFGMPSKVGLPDLLSMAMYLDNDKRNPKEKEAKKKSKELTKKPGKSKKKYAALGSGPGYPDLFSFLNVLTQGVPNMTGTSDDFHTGDPSVDYGTTSTPGFNPDEQDTNIFESGTFEQPNKGASRNADQSKLGQMLDGLLSGEGGSPTNTFGNTVGLIGNLVSTFGPMQNTLKNRAGDTPNVNMFKDFGNDALDVINDTKGYVAGQKDNALKDVDRAVTSNKSRSRNTARGVNQMRALDLASDMAANQSRENIYDNFAKQMMGILSQEASLENQQDQVVMQGEQNRDLADRQDRDNFYTQMAQDIATKGQGIQQIGKDLNQAEQQKVIMKMLNQLSKYGITFDGDYNLQNPED